jgi:hypothetical protein
MASIAPHNSDGLMKLGRRKGAARWPLSASIEFPKEKPFQPSGTI